MPVTTEFEITWSYYDNGSTITTTDFTSRTLGLRIDVAAQVGQVGTRTATVTFDNNDGAMTPGNGGTYGAWDFFERQLFIQATVSDGTSTDTAPLFSGIATDFALNDDGQNSTVVVTAVDPFQVQGRSTPTIDYPAFTNVYPTNTTVNALLAVLFQVDDDVPTFGWTGGAPSWGVVRKDQIEDEAQHAWAAGEITGAAADVINQNILPSDVTSALPDAARGVLSAYKMSVGRLLWYEATNPKVSFANKPGSVGLPFAELERGFNTDELTNAANITAVSTTTTATSSVQSSRSKYGARTRTYTVTGTDDYADRAAGNWANRFADSSFDVRTITTSTAQIEDQLDPAGWMNWVYALSRPAWHLYDVTFTPTNGTETTETLVSVGYTIDATPQDAIVTFAMRPAATHTVFTLDSDDYGILDTNRLG